MEMPLCGFFFFWGGKGGKVGIPHGVICVWCLHALGGGR